MALLVNSRVVNLSCEGHLTGDAIDQYAIGNFKGWAVKRPRICTYRWWLEGEIFGQFHDEVKCAILVGTVWLRRVQHDSRVACVTFGGI